MLPEDFDRLRDDIDKNGLRQKPVRLGDMLIDGQNRVLACKQLGREIEFEEYKGDTSDTGIAAYIISVNLRRRHLSPVQRAAIGANLLPYYAQKAHERKVALEKNFSEQELGRASKQVGAIVCVNEKYVERAAKVKQSDPELFERMVSGSVTMAEVEKELLLKAPSNKKPKDDEPKEEKMCRFYVPLDTKSVCAIWGMDAEAVFEMKELAKSNGLSFKFLA